MPEPLTTEELAEAIRVTASLPPGPWPVEPSEFGVPDAVGPICYLQTWSGADQLPVVEFIHYAREAFPKFIGEVSRLLDRQRVLERRIKELENAKSGAPMAGDLAFGWARDLDAVALGRFIEDLWGATSGPNGLITLDAIEAVIAEHRPDDTSPLAPVGEGIRNPLTRRQTEVLTHLSNGVPRGDIATGLGISAGSVRNCISDAYQRLGARTEAHAVAIAQRHGWIPDPNPRYGAPGERPRGRSPEQWRAIHQEWVAQMRRQPGTSVAIGPYISRDNTRPIIQRLTTGAIDGSAPGSFAAHPVVTGPSRVMVHGRYLGDPATRDTARTPDEEARP